MFSLALPLRLPAEASVWFQCCRYASARQIIWHLPPSHLRSPQPTHSSPQPPPCASSHSCSFFFVVVAQLGLFITLCGHCVPAFEVFTESREATALVTAQGCENTDGANQGGDGETKVPGLPPWLVVVVVLASQADNVPQNPLAINIMS